MVVCNGKEEALKMYFNQGELPAMEHRHNCLICGEPLVYSERTIELECMYCHRTLPAQTHCRAGHFICDSCHAMNALDLIRSACLSADTKDPFSLALDLVHHPAIKMHGPEHHFLIPAVLLTVYSNVRGEHDRLAARLDEAQLRAKNVLGGFCGYYGNCGAAVGTGIFASIALGTTPLSEREWQLTNLITATVLKEIALQGGPRCCKRNTFIALDIAAGFCAEHLGLILPREETFRCGFQALNKECRGRNCLFSP